ncbi:MAG: hypothetical protein GIW99_07765 [Candidatus Eremiobacteraeota bacterium]|nr:hypothetical protein [Candidatus Eremiobacteraeota bacterium]MBC5827559.1 hypothetical protein [Candidatus Eremiobacteraeota bacterium]
MDGSTQDDTSQTAPPQGEGLPVIAGVAKTPSLAVDEKDVTRKPTPPAGSDAQAGVQARGTQGGGGQTGFGRRLHELEEQLPHAGDALANLAKQIPGFAGYKAVEDRRTADKQLRAAIGERLSRVRDRLSGVVDSLSRGGNLSGLALIDQSGRRLERLIDRMRFADYGYAAVFDRVQVGEPELARLYDYDDAIMQEVSTFEDAATQVERSSGDPAALAAALTRLDGLTSDFDRRFDARKHLFDGLHTG